MIFSDVKAGDIISHPAGDFVVTSDAVQVDDEIGGWQITGSLNGVDAVWLAESTFEVQYTETSTSNS